MFPWLAEKYHIFQQPDKHKFLDMLHTWLGSSQPYSMAPGIAQSVTSMCYLKYAYTDNFEISVLHINTNT